MWLFKSWLDQGMIQPIIAPTFYFPSIYFFASDKIILVTSFQLTIIPVISFDFFSDFIIANYYGCHSSQFMVFHHRGIFFVLVHIPFQHVYMIGFYPPIIQFHTIVKYTYLVYHLKWS